MPDGDLCVPGHFHAIFFRQKILVQWPEVSQNDFFGKLYCQPITDQLCAVYLVPQVYNKIYNYFFVLQYICCLYFSPKISMHLGEMGLHTMNVKSNQ